MPDGLEVIDQPVFRVIDFYRFGHDSLLWPEFRIPILLLEKSCASNPFIPNQF
jgi:hypothetical protein